MQKLLTLLVLACAATLAFASTSSSLEGEAINKLCPIGQEAIDGKTFADYDGHHIGFCCPGCDKKFLAWDAGKKDAFVKAALKTQGTDTPAADAAKKFAPNEPYTLETCPVSGEKLGSMGEAIVLDVDGRQVKLCCKGCVKKFEQDKAKHLAVVDEGLTAQQLPYYPLDTCIVSGEPLVEDGKSVAVDVVIGNRLFRTCCKECVKALNKNSGKYLAELDAAVIKAQLKDYPLETCIVRDKGKLGSMGDPVQRVVGNRLVQFCCGGCEPAFAKDPAAHLAKLDAAWAAHGKHKRKAKGESAEHGHGDHGKGGGH